MTTVAQVSDYIEHDGKWWRKVGRKGIIGDTILFYDGWIAKVNPDGAHIDVSAGNTLLNVATANDHTVLEPLGTVDDIHVHEGAAYRKVARKAHVGELVLVVHTEDANSYQNGAVTSVTGYENAHGNVYVTLPNGVVGGDNYLIFGEYVVLEPLSDDPPATADDPVFASLAQFPPEITLSDVYEVYAHGKRAMAQAEFEAEELRYKHDGRRLNEALMNEDIGAADGYWTLVTSHHEKMTYWRKEIEKWDSEIERNKKSAGGR